MHGGDACGGGSDWIAALHALPRNDKILSVGDGWLSSDAVDQLLANGDGVQFSSLLFFTVFMVKVLAGWFLLSGPKNGKH
jgi:hypothetical protein